MPQEGVTWFLLADGRRARLLVEPRRGATLQEPADWALSIGADDLYAPRDRPARSHDRFGEGRHAMDMGRNLHEQEEEGFLQRVAGLVADAERRMEFDHLVIAAPPRALGLLRGALPAAVQARLRADVAKDLLGEDVAALRARLTDLLRG
jgi:protein required for attachment to host cells